MFREIGDNSAFRSIASARSFPIVGQLVGQTHKYAVFFKWTESNKLLILPRKVWGRPLHQLGTNKTHMNKLKHLQKAAEAGPF